MQTSFRKRLGIYISLAVIISVFPFGITASASEYTETVEAFSYEGFEIPAYDGDLYEEINGNIPTFTENELTQDIYERYGELDSLNRVTQCEANIDRSLMPAPDEQRGDIGSVYPTGWHQNKYEFVSGKYLYNRSHLIGWQLTAENANKNNLMTGTRSFNASGMLPFENAVADYVRADSENNVLYRVTPVFQEDNLLASGVIMEAESVDDKGKSVSFCVFVYNVERGVALDYSTGFNTLSGAEIDISGVYIRLSSLNFTYTGKAIEPLEYVQLDYTNLTKDEDYTVSYSNNVKAGTATVTVTGIYPYTGSASATFRIYNPKPKSSAIKTLKRRKKAFYVTWKAVSGVSGYQLQYSTNKRFKNAKTLTVNSKTAKARTVKKLKAKKIYYVRVRTYKTVNKKKFFSVWSGYKTVKTR
ncbi:MAG: DNA/RNA non-specific endonuclease [Eubacterium sp.]|nr:DNA/RNA non-specific endonuclease [Eubacterium sp.]